MDQGSYIVVFMVYIFNLFVPFNKRGVTIVILIHHILLLTNIDLIFPDYSICSSIATVNYSLTF